MPIALIIEPESNTDDSGMPSYPLKSTITDLYLGTSPVNSQLYLRFKEA